MTGERLARSDPTGGLRDQPGDPDGPDRRRWRVGRLFGPRSAGRGYDAFISYSHAGDGEIARALQAALQAFARPWYRLRSLRVFRDTASLSANPALWSTIQQALQSSRFFVLVASPEAAARPWVGKEVEWWREHKSVDALLIVLTAGEIAWDDQAGDFDRDRTTALPAAIRGAFSEEPLFVDLRSARAATRLSSRHPDLREAVATLSSAILGRPRDELIGEDIRRHRRAMQVATGAAAAIACFGAVAAWQWVEATQQRNRAREQAAIALSRQLAAQAASSLDESSVLGALLSLEAYRAVEDEDVRHRFEARNSMLLALQRDPRAVSILPLIANGVAFAPGGRTLAVAGEDRSVRLLDVARRAPLGEPLSGHTDAVSTVAFNAQGTMLASGGRDQKIFVRRFPGGDLLHEWNGNGGILALAFSPRGDTLASADGHTVQIWQLGQRSSPGTRLPGGPGFAESVSFSPDGKTLASAGEDGVMLWDVDPTPRRRQRLESELMTTVAFAPDGRTLAAGGSNGLRFWDVRRRVRLRRHRPGDVRSISFSADGKRLVSGHGDYTVRLWDVPSASQVGPPLRGHSGWAWGVAFGPDGRIVASASYDATVRLWRAGVRAPPARSVPNPGASQEELASIVGVGFRPDDKALVSADENGWIGRWRGRSPRLVSTSLAPTAEGDRRIVLRSDGNVLAVATENGSVGLWDLAGREARSELVAGSDVDAKTIAFTDDGEYLVAGSEDGTVRVWDVDSNEVVVRLETKREVGVVASRRTADVVATAANDAITLWDTDRRAPLGDPLRGHSGGIADLAFSPDGDVLASTGLDGTIRLWNVDTRRPLGEPLRGHTDAVVDLTFAPAGLTLASGSRDKTVRLWDIARRTQLGQPLPAGDQVSTVAFSADGRSVAAGGTFGRITVWRDILPGASIAEWRKRLCPIAQRNLTRAEWEEFLPDEPYRATCSEFPLDRLATPGG